MRRPNPAHSIIARWPGWDRDLREKIRVRLMKECEAEWQQASPAQRALMRARIERMVSEEMRRKYPPGALYFAR